MSVFDLFGPLKPFISFDKHTVDNAIFRLHSKITVLIILTANLLVTAQTFIGDPIDCVVNDVPPAVMDTYCWIHSTFTLPGKYLDEGGVTAHPGVGNQGEGEQVTHHKYYQWVVFTLFFQAILFYVPRWIWIHWEGQRMERLVPVELSFAMTDPRLPLFPKPPGVLSEDVLKEKVEHIRDHFIRYCGRFGAKTHSIYFTRFVFCEFLNLINVVCQIFFVDLFLDGMFTSYGFKVIEMSNLDPEERTDPMNLIFPKVAKCTFERFGPTGTIEVFDGLCVLPINIINEKIYILLWFWFIILSLITSLFLVYRLTTICSRALRKWALRTRANMLVDTDTVDRITNRITIGDWFFLMQLGMNIDPFVFAVLLREIDATLLKSHKLFNHSSQDKMEKIA
jgi:hypothetical protein